MVLLIYTYIYIYICDYIVVDPCRVRVHLHTGDTLMDVINYYYIYNIYFTVLKLQSLNSVCCSERVYIKYMCRICTYIMRANRPCQRKKNNNNNKTTQTNS
jgi:hypothetical protein